MSSPRRQRRALTVVASTVCQDELAARDAGSTEPRRPGAEFCAF
jgi:hypothetical protein